MKILKLYTYDYYEWEEPFAVSENEDALIAEYERIKSEGVLAYSDCSLLLSDEAIRKSGVKEPFWTIEDIKQV